MNNLYTYAKYIFPFAFIGFVLDLYLLDYEMFKYIGIFIGSLLATKKITSKENNSEK